MSGRALWGRGCPLLRNFYICSGRHTGPKRACSASIWKNWSVSEFFLQLLHLNSQQRRHISIIKDSKIALVMNYWWGRRHPPLISNYMWMVGPSSLSPPLSPSSSSWDRHVVFSVFRTLTCVVLLSLTFFPPLISPPWTMILVHQISTEQPLFDTASSPSSRFREFAWSTN